MSAAIDWAKLDVGYDWTTSEVYRPTRLEVDDASTLPGAVYSDPDFHDLEKQRVWHSSWVCVAEQSDVLTPGTMFASDVAGTPIVLTRDSSGALRGFQGETATVGSLEELPEVPSSHVGCALGLVFVNLNGEAPPLREWLGDLVPWLEDYEKALTSGQLIATHRTSYDIAANWKLLIENFLEYYHLPAVHPALCNVSGVDEHQRFQGRGMYMGFATHPLTKGGTAIDPGRLPPFPAIKAHRHETAYHLCIFPNVFFSLYPEAFFRVRLTQQSPTRTVEYATLQTHAAAMEAPDASAILQEVFEFWDNVNTEDILICENVQLGTSSPAYTRGRFSFRFEETIHRFQNMVIDKMLVDEPTRFRVPVGDDDTTFLELTARSKDEIKAPKESTVAAAQRARANADA